MSAKSVTRNPVRPETLEHVASEMAGIPVGPSQAIAQAAELEAMLEELDRFRALPLKDIALPLVFIPESGEDA